MTKTQRVLSKILLATVLTGGSIYLFAPWEYGLYYLYPLPDSIEAQVDQVPGQGVDGYLLYVDVAGEAPLSYASGWHNRQAQLPARPDALFKIASIGKLYDASAVAKLVAGGKLSLDGTLSEYLPTMAARIQNADRITLRMLVQHRSGIPNYVEHPDFRWDDPAPNVIEMILDEPADFEPDAEYSYSNSNYLLLAKIMDEVLGYPYGKFMLDEVTGPLGLERTYFSMEGFDPRDLMSGYFVDVEADFKDLDQGYVATAKDVGVFLRALNDGTFFNDEEQAVYESLYELEHTGWVLGYSSIARYHADIDAVVIQFTSTTGNDIIMLTQIIYNRVLKILRQRLGT
ncbi:MAG: serine hydrolase domain-containing protein [Pseudomonadota bacterium]